jgi:hypothetical protein
MTIAAITEDEIGALNFAPRRKDVFVIGTRSFVSRDDKPMTSARTLQPRATQIARGCVAASALRRRMRRKKRRPGWTGFWPSALS